MLLLLLLLLLRVLLLLLRVLLLPLLLLRLLLLLLRPLLFLRLLPNPAGFQLLRSPWSPWCHLHTREARSAHRAYLRTSAMDTLRHITDFLKCACMCAEIGA